MTRRIVSRFYAVFILFCFAIGYVLTDSASVFAMANVTSNGGSGWGTTGQIPINISNASVGETISCTIRVDGTLTRCYDSQDHEGSVSGNTGTCVLTVNNGNINTIQSWYCIFVTGENITSVTLTSVTCGGGTTPTTAATTQPTTPTTTQPPATTPQATTPAPAQTNPTNPAPAQTEPGTPVSTAAPTAAPVQPDAQVQPAAPAADVQPAVPAQDAPAEAPAAAAPAEPAATEAAPEEATEAAAAAAPQEAAANPQNNDNSGDAGDAAAAEETDAEPTESTEQTTVPIIIMDAEGNLISVTPTPTPFPYMSGTTSMKYSDDFAFPLKQVLIVLAGIAILGARFFVLKARGLRGGSLLLEFVPGVSDAVDRLRRRGTKIEQSNTAGRYDYSNSTSARVAEAAREAQQARAEFARAARERAGNDPKENR